MTNLNLRLDGTFHGIYCERNKRQINFWEVVLELILGREIGELAVELELPQCLISHIREKYLGKDFKKNTAANLFVCFRCDHLLKQGEQFCGYCGKAKTELKPLSTLIWCLDELRNNRKCSACGVWKIRGYQFCPQCGKSY